MTTIRRAADNTRHKIEDQTDGGAFLTVCGDIIQSNAAIFDNDDGFVNCPSCLNPTVKPLTVPSTGRAATQYRRPKNAHREMKESLKFAHKEIVASLEWMERGGEDQFLKNALDRANLAYRFLKEILIEHKRLPPEPTEDDYLE